ncbi:MULTISPECIES: hypothetical protein [Flavobacterium]|uniref:hypothetical protein n=1 Tax=Flavobacterium TaxID=237 RepID=UPI0022257C70|nr:hypothetical protein [Flavobacterium sp. N1846]
MKTISLIIIKVIKSFFGALCNDLVLFAGHHNYFEMFLIAFCIELKSTIFS